MISNPPYAKQIGLSVRAGAVKSCILMCGSIAEASLRAHAEKRQYKLHARPNMRTFGNILLAWKSGGNPRPEIASICSDLDYIRDTRNNIHLFKAASDPNSNFKQVLGSEQQLLGRVNGILSTLQQIQSP